MELKFTYTILRENDRFVAYCFALDLSTFGDTTEEVRRRFEEIAKIFIEELIEANSLEAVLLENGWTKKGKGFNPPEVISTMHLTLQLP